MKEFKNDIDRLRNKRRQRNSHTKYTKKYVLENVEALHNGLNIIVEAFENQIFESKYRLDIDVDIDPTPDSYTYKSHGLTDKELQMFRKLFGYKKPLKSRKALTEATDEEYNEFLKDFNIKLTVLKDQINTNTGVSRTRLENLVNAVEDILDSVRWHDNIPVIEIEESAAQRRNQPERWLKILIPYQMLSRLPISLAQLKAGNNSEKLKNEISQLLYSLQR